MKLPAHIEKYRVRTGQLASDESYGCNGAFSIPHAKETLFVIISDEMGWDHASVSVPSSNRCPIWEEMCFIKSIFWDKEETVIQYHPEESSYVNLCSNCLHLWRKQGQKYELPPRFMLEPH